MGDMDQTADRLMTYTWRNLANYPVLGSTWDSKIRSKAWELGKISTIHEISGIKWWKLFLFSPNISNSIFLVSSINNCDPFLCILMLLVCLFFPFKSLMLLKYIILFITCAGISYSFLGLIFWLSIDLYACCDCFLASSTLQDIAILDRTT